MHSYAVLSLVVVVAGLSHTAVYPWVPYGPWWVRAPHKDIPASVNIQQLGGSYAYSTAEGKAYEAVAPASVIQPPVAAVQVQAVPTVSVRFLPNGQAVLVPSVVAASAPGSASSPPAADAGSENGGDGDSGPQPSDNEVSSDPAVPDNIVEPSEPREPAPVTEVTEDIEPTESS